MHLKTLFETEYSPLRRLSQKSINCYTVTLRHFDRHLATVENRPAGPANVADLTDLTVARFIAERERATCRATAGRDRCQLLALWRYAARKRLPGANGQAVIAYTSSEVSKIIRTAQKLNKLGRSHAGATGGVPVGAWWSTLFLILWESGERITAVLGTRWRDVDLEGRRILFRAETRKFMKSDLSRRISPLAAEWLAGRVGGGNELVWPWRRNASVLWLHAELLCKAAGVNYRGFHAVRRATVSYCEAAEKGAGQRAADHESGTTTRRSYLDPRIVDEGPQPVDLLPPLNLETPPPQPEGDG